jgi:uncharacterized protein (TIGR02145 family)
MNFVKIGKLEWCTEDARFTQSKNGDNIPIAKSIAEWDSYCLNDEYCCCAYDFDNKNINKYGLMYNVHVVKQAESVVPEGTRLATYDDWCDLIVALGSNVPKDKYSQSEALLKLKSDKGWLGKIEYTVLEGENWKIITNTLSGTNETGFNALPGGYKDSEIFGDKIFYEKGKGVSWWTSDFANPHVSANDKMKIGPLTPGNADNFFNLKYSYYKLGRYMRLIKL